MLWFFSNIKPTLSAGCGPKRQKHHQRKKTRDVAQQQSVWNLDSIPDTEKKGNQIKIKVRLSA